LVDRYQTLRNYIQEDSDLNTTVTEICVCRRNGNYPRLSHNGKKLSTFLYQDRPG